MRLRRFRLRKRNSRIHGHTFANVGLRATISYTIQSQNSSRNLRLNTPKPARRRSQNPQCCANQLQVDRNLSNPVLLWAAEVTDSGLVYRGHGVAESQGGGVIVDLDKAAASIRKAVEHAENACGAAVESAFQRVGDAPLHIYALPLDQHGEVIGGLVIVHDASYIRAESLHIW